MARLPYARLFGGVVLAISSLAGLARVYGDDVPCYQSITDIPCPSAEPSFDTCEVQYNNLPEKDQTATNCGKLSYSARSSGPFGEGTTTPCLTPGPETGYKCVPELDKDLTVVRVGCAFRYDCYFNLDEKKCVKLTVTKTYTADKYKLTTDGCLPVKKEEEN